MSTKAELEQQIADLTEQLEARMLRIQQDAKRIDTLTVKVKEVHDLRDRCNRYEDVIDQLNYVIDLLRVNS